MMLDNAETKNTIIMQLGQWHLVQSPNDQQSSQDQNSSETASNQGKSGPLETQEESKTVNHRKTKGIGTSKSF